MKNAGDQIGRYVIEGTLGSGGMGEVYEATDSRLGRKVALKLVRSDGKPTHAQRLLREAQAIAAFEHPNAVMIYDVGETNDDMFIAMELVRGRSLRSLIGTPSIPLGQKLRWLVDAARALGAAHRARLIHRDVKPDNIMVRNDGVVKVLDFGIARLARNPNPDGSESKGALSDLPTVTAEGTLVGTPRYLAPEQLRGEEIDGRTDEFAWAVTAYELLTGEAPFHADTPVALISKILTSTPKPLRSLLPEAPEALERALLRAMAKRPDERFADIDEAADAIESFADAPTDKTRSSRDGQLAPLPAPANTIPDPSSKVCCDPASPTPSQAERPKTPAHSKYSVRRGFLYAAGATLVLALGTFFAMTRPKSAPQQAAPQSDPAPPALMVSSLGCEPATLEGGHPVPDLDRAIGYAACGRLAVNLGVDWEKEKPSHTLSVHAALSEKSAEVKLSIGDKTSLATASTPLEAIVEAIPKLQSQLVPGPLSPEETARWGGKDAEEARKIRRQWLRMVLDYDTDDQAAIRELLRSTPESPRSNLMAVIAEMGTPEDIKANAERTYSLLGKLPPPQANYVRFMLEDMGFEEPGQKQPKQALSLRDIFSQDPEDISILATLAIRISKEGSKDEGRALLERLWKQAPPQAAWITRTIDVMVPDQLDTDDWAKLIELMRKHYPEALAWDSAVMYHVQSHQIPKARQAVELGKQLGLMSGASGNFYFDVGRAWLELATWSPKEAREVATWMMGIPRPMIINSGTNFLAASYFLEGRIGDATNLLGRRLDHQKDGHAPRMGMNLTADLLQRLWWPQPLPGKERLSHLEALAAQADEKMHCPLHQLYLELSQLAADPKHDKKKGEGHLKEVLAYANGLGSEQKQMRERLLLLALPGIRRLKGNAEAAKHWQSMSRAPFSARRAVALEAALSLLGVGNNEEAEAAFKLSEDPRQIEFQALQTVAARIRRAAFYRSLKRDAEAKELEDQITGLWVNADPGVREHFANLK